MAWHPMIDGCLFIANFPKEATALGDAQQLAQASHIKTHTENR
jgi:hypothetical protein